MNLFRSASAVAGASGDGHVDWSAAADAAKASTAAGDLDLTDAEQAAYAADVAAARDRLREVTGAEFDVPESAQILNRHHWIDKNIETFARVMAPLEEKAPGIFPGVARVMNTGSMSFALGMLARKVLGQYDPLLLADDDEPHVLYFVHPNIEKAAEMLDVDFERFRRWIAFHEVAHAAEFGAAPWLTTHLESQVEESIRSLSSGHFDRAAFREVNTTMTAVEGYAELVMDRAFDDEYADLREKLDERRRSSGLFGRFIQRILGLGMKRKQYERGKHFFEVLADERGMAAANAVWDDMENLPSEAELDEPTKWLARVDP